MSREAGRRLTQEDKCWRIEKRDRAVPPRWRATTCLLLGPGPIPPLCTSVLSLQKKALAPGDRPRNPINTKREPSLTPLILHRLPSIYRKCLLMLRSKYVFRIWLHLASSIHHCYCSLSQHQLLSGSMQWTLLLSLPKSRWEGACSFWAMHVSVQKVAMAPHYTQALPTLPYLVFCYMAPPTLLSSHSGRLAVPSTLLTWPTVSVPTVPSAQEAFALVSLCQSSRPLQGFAQISPSW